MSEKISVLVPAYNTEKYIKQCVQSICQQTYQNIEIIVINDGSTDKTGKILEEMKANESRLRIVHKKENGGYGAACNDAVSMATGDYISFVDSDDWIDANHLEDLYDSLKSTDSDISIANLSRYFDDNKSYSIHISEDAFYQKVYTPQEWFQFQYGHPNFISTLFTVPWGKLYKRDLFDLILYPDKHAGDDYTTWKLYLLSDKIVYSHRASYIYRVHSASMTQVGDKKDVFSYEAIEERLSLLSVLGFDLKREIDAYKWRLAFNKQLYVEAGEIAKYKDIVFKQKLIDKYSLKSSSKQED